MSVVKLASDNNQVDIIMKLVKLKPTLLTELAKIESDEVIKQLLTVQQFMLLTDDNGNNLLHLACKNNNNQLASRILEKGHIDVNQQNNEGKTALNILQKSTLESEKKASLEALLEQFSDTHLSDTSRHTPSDLAAYDPMTPDLMGDNSHTD